ncbi:MAG: S66 peptidase family protein [Egibacteraceae bacterium]
MEPLSRAPRLRAGDRVRIVAPSGPLLAGRLEAGTQVLRSWGLHVEATPPATGGSPFGYLSADDATRARDLQDAWCDPAVAAVFCARGGYGAQRMLDLLDWDVMHAATADHGPKVLLGFSDITALHEAFAARLGVATLLGPMPTGTPLLTQERTRDHLRATLLQPESAMELHCPHAGPLVGGRAMGVLVGGTASLLSSGLGTPCTRDNVAGGLLVLEDIGEEPYRLDRIFTQMRRTGYLDGVNGVICCTWIDCGTESEVNAVLRDRFGDLGVPVLQGLCVGHGPVQLTVALGCAAEMDADAGVVHLLQPALV